MSPSAEAYTHKDFSQQVMLRPISSDSLGAGERCAEKLTGLGVLKTHQSTHSSWLFIFWRSICHVFYSFHVLKKFHVFFSGTSLIKLSYSQPRIFPHETGSCVAQPGLELATAEDDLELIFHLSIAGHFIQACNHTLLSSDHLPVTDRTPLRSVNRQFSRVSTEVSTC